MVFHLSGGMFVGRDRIFKVLHLKTQVTKSSFSFVVVLK